MVRLHLDKETQAGLLRPSLLAAQAVAARVLWEQTQ
jgi:hypothetical protein